MLQYFSILKRPGRVEARLATPTACASFWLQSVAADQAARFRAVQNWPCNYARALSDKVVIFGVSAYPKPDDILVPFNANGSVFPADTHRVETTNFFEM